LSVEPKIIVIEKPAERSPIESDMAILEACKAPQMVTAVMYATNCNCSVLKVRLEWLVSRGLMVFHPKYRRSCRGLVRCRGGVYLTSSEGLELLVVYHSFLRLYKG